MTIPSDYTPPPSTAKTTGDQVIIDTSKNLQPALERLLQQVRVGAVVQARLALMAAQKGMITLEGEKILLDLPLHFIKQSGQLVQIQAKPDPRSPQNMLLVLTKIPAPAPAPTPTQAQTNIIPKTGVTHVAILPDAGQARGQTGAQVLWSFAYP